MNVVIKHCCHGTFNINVTKPSDNISLKYKDILSEDDLGNVIEKPTRNGNALLDHIITNTMEKVSNHVSPCLSISDHYKLHGKSLQRCFTLLIYQRSLQTPWKKFAAMFHLAYLLAITMSVYYYQYKDNTLRTKIQIYEIIQKL